MAAEMERDWSALPAGVLQLIMYKASTWQAPGSCLAAPVCRSWRSAAAGCKDIHLLYFMGRAKANSPFKAWLSQHSPQLGAFTLSAYTGGAGPMQILQALAEAAEAAQAAGACLQLHTLRVLSPSVSSALAGRLVACLPRLRCLQLGLLSPQVSSEVQAALQPLNQATQLHELYLRGPSASHQDVFPAVAGLLPLSLERLGWSGKYGVAVPDLSHLTGVTFLRLCVWSGVTSAKLPPALQQLELHYTGAAPDVLEQQQQQVVSGWRTYCIPVQQQLGLLKNLKELVLELHAAATPAVSTALVQLTKLSALVMDASLRYSAPLMPAALAAMGSIRSLRCLELRMGTERLPDSLPILEGLTRLVTCTYGVNSSTARHCESGEVIGRMAGLQWLSVPGVLLAAGCAWLGGMQQLRVLVVRCEGSCGEGKASIKSLLIEWGRSGLPPRLQLVCVVGLAGGLADTDSLHLRQELRQVLRGSGCELVWGVNLDEVCDPAQQLAGLPVTLQQVLA